MCVGCPASGGGGMFFRGRGNPSAGARGASLSPGSPLPPQRALFRRIKNTETMKCGRLENLPPAFLAIERFTLLRYGRAGPFCRRQRPNGRPQAVPVRRQPYGHRQRSKGVPSPSRQNVMSPETRTCSRWWRNRCWRRYRGIRRRRFDPGYPRHGCCRSRGN